MLKTYIENQNLHGAYSYLCGLNKHDLMQQLLKNRFTVISDRDKRLFWRHIWPQLLEACKYGDQWLKKNKMEMDIWLTEKVIAVKQRKRIKECKIKQGIQTQ